MIEIQGSIEELIFYNEDNGYTIAVMETEEDRLTVVGYLPSCHEGRSYLLRGDFIVHPRYGEQFSFKESEEVMPSTEEGIAGFLSSGILKGIGPKAARAIVKRFGEETFAIIEETPERLTEVSGIGEKKAEAISLAFRAHREFAEISLSLQKYDISSDYALKLYKVYGGDTVKLIEANPYRLVDDLFGVGFKKADKIAEKIGVEKEDKDRIKSGAKYTLNYFLKEGHTFLPRKELCEKTGELLEVESLLVDEALVEMTIEGAVQIENLEGRDVVFLMIYFLAEQYVTKALMTLSNAERKPINGQIDSLISLTEKEAGISFSEEQKHAVKTSLISGVSVITGGPGTGKTTIINGIIKILEGNGFKTAVA
ncbi:MAG: helix-hairpin-helix domain-containing protein, partial [Anaerovoracaceae bacterium]